MRTVNVNEAKTHLSKLLARVAKGEEVMIAKAGRPVARLVPVTATRRMDEVLGIDKGRISLARDFTAPRPGDVQAAFEGAPADPA